MKKKIIIFSFTQKILLGCIEDKVVKKAKVIRKRKKVATARKTEEIAIEIPIQISIETNVEVTRIKAGKVVKKKIIFKNNC